MHARGDRLGGRIDEVAKLMVQLAETPFVMPCSKGKQRGDTSTSGTRTGIVLDYLTNGIDND